MGTLSNLGRGIATKALSLAHAYKTRSYIHPTVHLRQGRLATVTIGVGSRICHHSLLVLEEGGQFVVGADVVIGTYNNIRVSQRIMIGDHVRTGQFVSILGDNHRIDRLDIPIADQGTLPADVIIDSDVWIGAHAIILPGVTIGRGAVIGAGCVVTRSVAPLMVVAGNPARVIRSRGVKTTASE